MDLFGKSPRPVFNEPMRIQLSNLFAKQIHEWCNKETPLQDIFSDCVEIFRFNRTEDGYELAKEFDKKGYSPDSQLVEILDSVYFESENILRDAIKRWVIEDKITPKFEIGASVFVEYGVKKHDGTVTEIRTETAEYLVCIPEIGMTIKDGGRAVIRYENAELSTNLQPA